MNRSAASGVMGILARVDSLSRTLALAPTLQRKRCGEVVGPRLAMEGMGHRIPRGHAPLEGGAVMNTGMPRARTPQRTRRALGVSVAVPRDCDVSEGRGRLTEKVCCNAGNGPVTVSMTRSFLLYNFTSIHCNQTQTCLNNFTSVDLYSMLKECERLAFPAGTLLPSSLHLPACPPCCPPVSAMPQAKGPWPCRVHPHAHSSQLGWAGQGRGTDKLEIQGILLSTIFWYHSSTISVTSKLSPRLELPFFIFFF